MVGRVRLASSWRHCLVGSTVALTHKAAKYRLASQRRYTMNTGLSRFDLRRIQQTLVGNLQHIRITGGTLSWAVLYALVLFLWWKVDETPELGLLASLALAGVFLLLLTLEYPLIWMKTRRKEFRQVMNAYYGFMDSLSPESRVGQPAKALWDALVELKIGLDDPDRQLERERRPDGQAEA